jgi:hypothetical protein
MRSEHGPRRLRTIDITAPICASCNHRWLSVLEGDVATVLAPLVRGESSRRLSRRDQRLLATWAVKTALMYDLSTGAPVIPTGFFHDFRLRRSPLSSHVVWLGAYSGERAVWARLRGLGLGETGGEPVRGFVATFTAFRAIFQVVGHFTRGGATIRDDRAWSAGLLRIWPMDVETVDWPRNRLAFDDDALVDLEESVVG